MHRENVFALALLLFGRLVTVAPYRARGLGNGLDRVHPVERHTSCNCRSQTGTSRVLSLDTGRVPIERSRGNVDSALHGRFSLDSTVHLDLDWTHHDDRRE